MLEFIQGLQFTQYTDLPTFIYGVIDLVISLSALLAVAFLIYAGFKYILSAGDEDKAADAGKTIVYTLLGLIICFIAPVVIRFVLNNVIGV
jgi:threonine/homoserine/homoserine lactone efflux protein